MRLSRPYIAMLFMFALFGCATYSESPLPHQADLAATVPAQGVAALDMDAVASVAVLNNPDLKAARAKAQVGQAQAFAAGLLPNPQFSAGLDQPTNQGLGLATAYSLGLSYNLQALITQPSKTAAANAARDQAKLDLLWQEWQTVAQARTLYVQSILNMDKQKFFAAAAEKYVAQAARSGRAFQAGDLGIDEAGGDLAILFDVRTRLGDAERSALQADRSLHALLGIAPEVQWTLQPLSTPEIPERAAVEEGLAKLDQTRPDLRALQAGYKSQEELLLKAVLSQFPNISVGFTRSSDTSNVFTNSFGITLDLPIFDQGQGEIAVQSATRDQLRAEYQARLDQATGDAWRIWAEMQQLKAEIQVVQARLPQLQTTVDNAQKAYAAGDMTAAAYLTMLNTLLAGQTELFDLKQSLWSDAIALGTVLGTQIEPLAKDSKS